MWRSSAAEMKPFPSLSKTLNASRISSCYFLDWCYAGFKQRGVSNKKCDATYKYPIDAKGRKDEARSIDSLLLVIVIVKIALRAASARQTRHKQQEPTGHLPSPLLNVPFKISKY